jgi:uncharacterized RmlC-like cupin family protein
MDRSGVFVVRGPDAPTPPGPATAGMDRRLLVDHDDRWVGWVRVEPGVASGWHHHADRDTYIFVVAGTMRIESGPGGAAVVEATAGDFIFVPKQRIHREVVTSTGPADAFLVRIGPGPQVVNVEEPEAD